MRGAGWSLTSIETPGARCYIGPHGQRTGKSARFAPKERGTAHSTRAFAALGDHARLPWRFFARLFASDGSLLAR